MSREENAPQPQKRRRKRKLLLAALLLLAGLLVWLNGPGWRWLGGIGLRHALGKVEIEGDFELKGTLLGGVRIEGLSLSGGVIRKLEIGSAGPLYEIRRLVRGELDGVKIDRIDAVIDLAAAPEKPEEEKKPFDPQELAATLRKIRELIVPMDLRAADLRFQLVRGEESLVDLDTSHFSHAPGSDEFRLALGALAVGPGHELPAQETLLRWTDEALTLDRFDITPRLGISGVRASLPPGGGLAAEATLRIEDSRLLLAGGLSSATVRMEGETLPVHEAAKNLALELPAEATLDSLEARIEGLDQSPDRWTGSVQAGVSSLRYEEWDAETLRLDARKDGDAARVDWSLAALDGEASGSADLRWRDLAAGAWTDFEAVAAVSVPRLAPIFTALREKLAFAPADAPSLPIASSLTLDAKVDSGAEGIRSADARWQLSPGETPPSPLAGEVKWTPDGKLSGTLDTAGLRAAYALDLTAKTYEADATLDLFRPETLAPWAAAAGVGLPAGMTASATWQGGGAFAAEPHRGSFDIPSFEWVRPDTPPLIVRTKGTYAWPQNVALEQLTAIAEGQTVHAEATLADRLLRIPRIEWLDGETRLIGGQAEIPIPEETGGLRDFLAQTEPVSVFLESEWIDHSRLAAWLPEGKSPLAGGSGRVHLIVTGTPAEPKIDLEAALRGIELPNQPNVPVTDVELSLDGAGDELVLAGEVRPASYPPVTLSGKMPFKPGVWAENPGSALEETFEARANIPRLELATFREFLPNTAQLAGTLEGFVSASGTLGKPDLAGELRLSGGSFSMDDEKVPPVRDLAALVRMNGDTVSLENLSLEISGGTLRASGRAGLADSANPTLDFTFNGSSLPLMRDESMIIRADAALAVRGSLREAGISGTVDIVDSLFYRDFEIIPVRMPFTAPSRPGLPSIDPDEKTGNLPEPFANWTLDVRVRTRDPLLVRGNLAEGSATADIRFGGTLGDIRPQGSAIISEVTARLPFSTLKVRNGRAVFTPENGLNPELDIRGTSTIGRYDVNVWFYGPVNAPKTALTSDPPLPESEIMTVLAAGTTSDGLEDGQAATLKAAQLLVEEWRRGRLPFGEQVAELVSVLNRVDLRIGEDDPLTGRRLNSATIELHDRWYVSGSIDKQSHTRTLLAFVIRFK